MPQPSDLTIQKARVGAWALTLMGVGFLAFELYTWNEARESESWSSVTGAVTSSKVREVRSDSGTKYFADVNYRYEVAGQTYTGDRVRIQLVGVLTERSAADAAIAPYPAGSPVKVFYDSDEPAEAALVPGRRRGLLSGHMAMAMFLLATGAFGFFLNRHWLEAARKSEPRGDAGSG